MTQIQHIQQRGYADCGVACIAMAAGVEYERVLGSVAPDVYFYGMYWGEVLHALKKITKQDWKLQDVKQKRGIINLRDLDIDRPVIIYADRGDKYEDILIRNHYIYINPYLELEGILSDPTRPNANHLKTILRSFIGDWKVLAAIYQE